MSRKLRKFLACTFVMVFLAVTGITLPAQVATADSGTVVQTSFSDFAQGCVTLSQNTTHVSDAGGGAVELAATQADDFPGTTLDSGLWTAGKWDPLGDPYTPTITNSVLIINPNDDAWVRSTQTFTQGVFEATAQFSAAAFEQIGFGSDGFNASRYFIFSTFSGDGDLYARVNNNTSEQAMDLGPLPSGMNRYRIEWTADGAVMGDDLVTFYVNGSQVAQFSIDNTDAADFYLYLSNAGGGTLDVDYAQAAPDYQTTGTYTSCPFDAGAGSAWQMLNWDATQTMNTSLSVKTSTSPDGVSWTDFADLNNSGDPIDHPDRWLQYQLILGTGSASDTPLVNAVSRTFGDAQADLTIAKSGPAQVDAGGVLIYTLNVSNAGPNVASSLAVSDTLPEGVTSAGASGTGWTCGVVSGLVTCTLPSQGVGSAPLITIQATSPVEAGTIHNKASVSSATADPVADNTSNTLDTDVVAQADLTIAKSGPAQVDAGGMLTYTLNVSNAGPNVASSLAVSDTLPAGLTNASASGTGWTCGVVSGLVTCTLPSQGVGSAPLITIQATAPVEAVTIHNKASVSSATADPVPDNTSNTLDTDVVAQADLTIAKSGPAQVNAGGVLTYTLNVSNAGPSAASSLVVSDTLPAGLTNASATGTGWGCGIVSGLVTCTLPSQGVGNAPLITIHATAPADAGAIHNKVSVSSATADPVADNTSNTVDTDVVAQADLTIAKSGPAQVNAGGVLTYTLNVSNAGPSAASSLVVSDTLPAGLTNASATGTGWSCGVVSDLVTCTLPNQGVGSAPLITIHANAPADAGTIHNKASVASLTADPVADNTSNTVDTNVIGQANLSIAKSGPAQVNAGGVFTYTLNVSNTGPSAASSLVVSDTLPAGLTNASASGTGWSCGVVSGLVTCNRTSLGLGSAPVITVQATAPADAGAIHNKASVSSATADPVSNNTSSTVDTNVTAQADLSINAQESPEPVKMNGTLAFTLTVSNTGPNPAKNVAVSYNLPSGVGFDSAAGTGWMCNLSAGTVTCAAQHDLAVGAASPITIVVQAPSIPGPFTNTFTVSSSTSDVNLANNTKGITSNVERAIYLPLISK